MDSLVPTSPRFNFSLAKQDEFEWLRRLYEDQEIMAKIPGGPMELVRSQKAAERAVKGGELPGLGCWIVRLKGSNLPVGYVVLRPFDWDSRFSGVELGYIIDRSYWGQGIASEAAAAISKFAIQDLGLTKLLALVNDGNFASIKVVERLGFKRSALKPTDLPNNTIWELNR